VNSALVVENLEKYFPPARPGWRALLHPFTQATQRALAGVSFALPAGRAMALIGPNGAGKSTLLRILGTLLLPTRGRAAVAGYDVEREPARVRQQIGFHTGGDGGFYARLTVRQNLRLFAALNNLSPAQAARRTARVSEQLGLGPVLDQQVRTLSTGTVHRLGLARAILHEPAVLLLDEPTRSLDPLTAAEFRRLVREELVRGQGTTLLFATHTLGEVPELADSVAVLDQGKLAAWDTPAGLLAATRSSTLEQAFGRLVAHSPERIAPR